MEARQTRSADTQNALMRATEKLIAEQGINSVSIRDIITEAGQKNQSALQYHFGNLDGLITAVHRSRDRQIQAKRAELLDALLKDTPDPSIRELARLMVRPPFELARTYTDFRDYLKAFGHEVMLTDEPALNMINRKTGESGRELGALLRAKLKHLDEEAYRRRMDGVLRLISATLVHQTRKRGGFFKQEADVFFSSLIDALVGLLEAPESEETKAIRQSSEGRSKR